MNYEAYFENVEKLGFPKRPMEEKTYRQLVRALTAVFTQASIHASDGGYSHYFDLDTKFEEAFEMKLNPDTSEFTITCESPESEWASHRYDWGCMTIDFSVHVILERLVRVGREFRDAA